MLQSLAKRIRHHPFLRSQEWLWNLLRKPFQFLLDPLGRGITVRIGGVLEARIPRDMAGVLNWDQYEKETIQFFCKWLEQKRNPLIVDVGSSIGIFSLAALAASPKARVIAFESDVKSIAVFWRLTRAYAGERLQVIHGLVTVAGQKNSDFSAALEVTRHEVRSKVRGLPKGNMEFICLTDPGIETIPRYSLDELLLPIYLGTHAILLKIDVEGAELLVLQGARAFIRKYRPDILLSAHPPTLPKYGHSMEHLNQELKELGYGMETLHQDHEIHLFCTSRT